MKDLNRLELEIDLRLRKEWQEMGSIPEEHLGFVAALCRSAYGCGYTDALREPVRGMLCEEFGYPIPERK